MHITLEADYALRIVHCLARDGGRMGAKVIAERACVTLRFSLKILRKLVSHGVVRSYKGSLGGYELAKPASMITVGCVLEAIQGPYILNRCLRDGHTCSLTAPGDYCAYHHLFYDLSNHVQQRLESVTIDQMINKSRTITAQ